MFFSISNPPVVSDHPLPFDLLRVPGLGRFLEWRHSRTLLAIPMLLISIAMIAHGLFGPSLAPKNLATVLSWVHFRGALVLVLLCAGNFFCLACPFMLVRNFARKFLHPRLTWPRALRNKWLSAGLFVLILFCYELFDLWASPWWTAWLIVGYFTAVLVVDGLFKHASFCKFVCPIGQFNFVASTLSPLEVAVRDKDICGECHTKDCIRGKREESPEVVILQRGCELALFQPAKVGNMDCTFCLDCVHACPHDNVGILARLPASELMVDPVRSGIGVFSRRKDLAALAIVFSFGALVNAFGMVSPVYVLEAWLGRLLHITYEAPVLGLIFTVGIVVEPIVLLAAATWITLRWAGVRRAAVPLAVRYSYSLVPIGFGIWLAHYCFHFLTGFLTIVPVTQRALADLGWPVLGEPLWMLTGLPKNLVQPLDLGFLALGFAGSLMVAYRLAEEDSAEHPVRAFVPWAAVNGLLFASSILAHVAADGDAGDADERVKAGMTRGARVGFRPLWLRRMLSPVLKSEKRRTWPGWVLVAAAMAWMSAPALAHNGPPFPIIENRRVGPVTISVWTNPDVGTGSFFVLIDPPPGGKIPNDLKVEVAVQPLSGRLAEKNYAAWRENLRGQVEYKTLVPFDAQEMWRVRVTISSAEGGGEAVANVEVTPPGLGRWDMLLYLLPFLGVGFLWFKAVRRKRLRRPEAIPAQS